MLLNLEPGRFVEILRNLMQVRLLQLCVIRENLEIKLKQVKKESPRVRCFRTIGSLQSRACAWTRVCVIYKSSLNLFAPRSWQ